MALRDISLSLSVRRGRGGERERGRDFACCYGLFLCVRSINQRTRISGGLVESAVGRSAVRVVGARGSPVAAFALFAIGASALVSRMSPAPQATAATGPSSQ